MRRFLAMTVLTLAASAFGDGPYPGTCSRGGISGFLFLPGGEVLPEGALRLQARLEYLSLRGDAGNSLAVPLTASWGVAEDIEIGGEVPFYVDDGIVDGSVTGDITGSCSWLYETANGGSSLILHGMLTLPTGEEGRDPGTELALGASTGTTFRLFRLQMSAFYCLNGGRKMFTDDVEDGLRFSGGGTSFLSEDLELAGALEGTTWGTLDAAASIAFSPLSEVTFFGTLRAGLEGAASYSISLGGAWTGAGF
jgi:hypothetical protein